jgi:cyclopropane-fatty-acyl-phospholipid synthase
VNAVEQSLAKGPERAPPVENSATAPPHPPLPQSPATALGEGKRADRWVLARMLASLGSPPIELAIRGGAHVGVEAPVARVTFDSRSMMLWVLGDVPLRFGDAYSDGALTVEGDLISLLESVYRAGRGHADERAPLTRRVSRVLHRQHLNTLSGSRENIHHHYDIGNPFYELWLGPTMAYTCAYYPQPTASLDEAQVAKMDYVCRKLRLRPGESVVEAGCGWGMLAMHMARRYGVRVRAFNISREQILWARERARREGLSGQVDYVEDDYRNITGRYDAFVSVGMLEHVGLSNYSALGGVVQRVLGGRGRGLIHSIGRNRPAPLQPWIEKRIFPGGYPPAPSEMARVFEPWDLSILDVENLRLHYAQTLRHWLVLFEGASERVRSMFDEKFVRMWRLYLAGSVAAFSTGTLQLFQVVFAPGESNDVPWTRAHLYTS